MSLATRARRSSLRRDTDSGDTSLSLSDLRPGQTAVVVGWNDSLDQEAVHRFEDLGFADGAEVTVLRRAPLGDPFVYSVAVYEIAVRREHTRHVIVERR